MPDAPPTEASAFPSEPYQPWRLGVPHLTVATDLCSAAAAS
jgi:hypothetical protein